MLLRVWFCKGITSSSKQVSVATNEFEHHHSRLKGLWIPDWMYQKQNKFHFFPKLTCKARFRARLALASQMPFQPIYKLENSRVSACFFIIYL